MEDKPLTTFQALKDALGASHLELAFYLGDHINKIKGYASGRIPAPAEYITKLYALLAELDARADSIADAIERQISEIGSTPKRVTIKVPSTTIEAFNQGLHFQQFAIRSALLGASRAGAEAVITTE